MPHTPKRTDSVDPAMQTRMRREVLLDRFEAAWQSGSRPNIAESLAAEPPDGQFRLLEELLRLDVEYRRHAGEKPRPLDYAEWLDRAPEVIDRVFSDTRTVVRPVPAPNPVATATCPQMEGNLPRTGEKPPALTAAQLEPGSEFGPYEILKTLGEGGMGTVYLARHAHLDKAVALKVLPKEFGKHPELVGRFRREMKAVGKIDHPHLVRAMDAGQIHGSYYLAMEYINGTNLSAAVKSRGPLSVNDACRVLHQASLALSAAHRAGLVHRDVKPSNLLISAEGKIKLVDLGLARLDEDAAQGTVITVFGQSFGTPDYMAPEQWLDPHAVDARTDLYALGCTLFFVLTGQTPYGEPQHRSAPKKMTAHLSAPIPDLQTLRPQVPDGLAAVYRRLMAKRPEQRYASAADVIHDLIERALLSQRKKSAP